MENKGLILPELLAPAGNMERLIAAFRFGADAVYVGAREMSLRNFADNFSHEELKEACNYAHERNKKVYLACNAFAQDDDLSLLPDLLKNAADAKVDALIVNDPGVIAIAKRLVPEIPLHLSTQANTLNSEAVKFWGDIGIERVVLARELSLQDVKKINQITGGKPELEIFIHGAMCISYSGRCLLSNYLTGRSSNKGECAQPCRWSYEIRESGKDGEYFPIIQDGMGTHIMNSRDMCLLEHIPEVIDSGAVSLKIEGRMKSVLYVSTVVNVYRMALDHYKKCVDEGIEYSLPHELADELNMVSHRPYTTGFAFGDPGADGQMTVTSKYIADCEISAVVLDYNEETKTAYIRQRNRFFVGDRLYILAPNDIGRSFTVSSIVNEDGENQEQAPHPNQRVYLKCDEPLKPGDVLRRIK